MYCLRNILKKFPFKDGLVLPMFNFFDDLEPLNALGSHAGENEVGAVYGTIPCFPSNFASKLNRIFFTDIFHSSDRSEFGNKAIFKILIDELKN